MRRAPGTLPALAAANIWRLTGVVFIVLTLQGQLAAHFAWPAGIGDVAIGLAAPIVGWAIWKRRSRRRLVVIFNTLGPLDLIMAVTLGVLSAPGAQIFTTEPSTQAMTLLPMVLMVNRRQRVAAPSSSTRSPASSPGPRHPTSPELLSRS